MIALIRKTLAVGKELQTAASHFKTLLPVSNTHSVCVLLNTSTLNGTRGGLMVSAPVSGSSVSNSSAGRGHCVVFFGQDT